MESNSRDMNRKSSIRAILLRKECLLFFCYYCLCLQRPNIIRYMRISPQICWSIWVLRMLSGRKTRRRVYVLENTPWRLQGVGLAHAIDRIQKTGLPEKGKSCRIVVLDNNIPQISLIYTANPDSLKAAPGSYAARSAWMLLTIWAIAGIR